MGMIIGCYGHDDGQESQRFDQLKPSLPQRTIFTPMHAIIEDICSVMGAKGAWLPEEHKTPVIEHC
jgi:hypothetical protein